jgi:nucleoside-diphosphate kinase
MRIVFSLCTLVFAFCSTLCATETFSMIKPTAVKEQHIGEILAKIEQSGLKIVAIKMMRLDNALASKFYKEHEAKPFFPDILKMMTSGPVVALVIEGDDAVLRLRKLIGATDPKKAESGTIRALFGKSPSENAIHASDSDQSATREIALFFTPNEIFSSNK